MAFIPIHATQYAIIFKCLISSRFILFSILFCTYAVQIFGSINEDDIASLKCTSSDESICAVQSSTTTLHGAIHSSAIDEYSTTRVVLNNGEYSTIPISSTGKFEIRNVSPGRHFLEVWHPTLIFSPISIEIISRRNSKQVVKIVAHIQDIEHGRGSRLTYPLSIVPIGSMEFHKGASAFNIASLLRNPLVIPGIISLVLLAILPKLQEGVSPEDLQCLTGATSNEDGSEEPEYESMFVKALNGTRGSSSGSHSGTSGTNVSKRNNNVIGQDRVKKH